LAAKASPEDVVSGWFWVLTGNAKFQPGDQGGKDIMDSAWRRWLDETAAIYKNNAAP
jgi:hypothetical protein